MRWPAAKEAVSRQASARAMIRQQMMMNEIWKIRFAFGLRGPN